MTTPDISVIIGAYNAMPYLTRTLTSVIGQSLGMERLEVIAVNDGSTDATGDELERFAAAHPERFTVIHQENSGGPSAPRNVGIEHARGRFVFFLDADDYLGEEALERMLAAAETNRTDVVLGRMVGVNGRGAPASMFVRNQPRTDVFNSRVYWALNPLKLFRRDLIERHGLRFPTGFKVCEDQFFTALAYLHADGISVVADYDCLFIVKRDDGQNITVTTRGAEQRIQTLKMMIDLVEEHVEPGPARDSLLNRHLSIDLFHALIHLAKESERSVQEKGLGQLRELLSRMYTPTLRQRVGAITRTRCEFVERGLLDELIELEKADEEHRSRGTYPDVLVEAGRAYARLPFFRDSSRGVPDECYEITRELQVRHRLDAVSLDRDGLHIAGHAYLRRVAVPHHNTELVLRERSTRVEHRFPARTVPAPGIGADEDAGIFDYTAAGFAVTIDLATAADGERLPRGLWDVSVSLDVEGITKEIRFGNRRDPDIANTPQTHVFDIGGQYTAAALYYTHPYDNLTMDVGENKHRVADKVHVDNVAWTPAGELEVTGSWTLASMPEDALRLRLTNRDAAMTEDAAVAEFAASPHGRSGFRVIASLSNLPAGTWTAQMCLGGGSRARLLGAVPEQAGLPAMRRRRRGLPWYAKPVKAGKDLALRIDRVRLTAAVTNRLKR
ncbi:glycosyltransferase [Streptomyces sp. NPDC096176]|uniref:glycosyltransferase n=1 Tax=Streptomyces sp. NPDC096176 TaxID=3366079 RepID=UPI0037F249DB